MEFGIRIESFGVHLDSGGPGRWRGGCGIVRDVRVLVDEATLGVRMDNCRYPAFGVNGGMSGSGGGFILNPGTPEERHLPTMSDGHRLKKDDLLRVITPGGGGWGSPLDRPAEDVLADVRDGFVSAERAFDVYGVVLGADGRSVDAAATTERRAALPRSSKMFHRGTYYDAVDDLAARG